MRRLTRRSIRRLTYIGFVLFGVMATAIVFLRPNEIQEAPSGTWVIVSSEDDPDMPKTPEGTLWSFEDGKATTWTKDGNKKTWISEFKADPGKNPKEIDFIAEHNGRKWVVPGIYKLWKGRLIICSGSASGDLPLNVGKRPTEFKSGKNIGLTELERVEN